MGEGPSHRRGSVGTPWAGLDAGRGRKVSDEDFLNLFGRGGGQMPRVPTASSSRTVSPPMAIRLEIDEGGKRRLNLLSGR